MMENRSFDHYYGTYPGVRGFDDHPAHSLGAFAQAWPGGAAEHLLPFAADALAKLQREVGGGRAHQLADVVDCHIATFAEPVRMLGLAHFCGTTSRRLSVSAWTETEIVLGSPITHPWL